MAISLSPAVTVIEKDLSTTVPAVSTSITGIVGEFEWGPVEYRGLVTSVRELQNTFGNVLDHNYEDWFTAYNNLQYNSLLYIVRAGTPTYYKNAGQAILSSTTTTTVSGSPFITNNLLASTTISFYRPNNDWEGTVTYDALEKLRVLAKYPGSYGNTIKVGMCNAASVSTMPVFTSSTITTYANYVDRALTSDEVVVVVGMNDLEGNTQIIESFIVSSSNGTKTQDGSNAFIQDYINNNSKYIVCYTSQNTFATVGSLTYAMTALSNGTMGTLTAGDYQRGYDLYANPEIFDINLILDTHNQWLTEANIKTIHEYIGNIAKSRLDCMAILTGIKADSVNASDPTTDNVTYAQSLSSNSYAALYSNWKYQYDPFRAKYVWVPVSGDIAGIFAYTDNTRETWFAPAGYNRGIMKNVTKFAYNPDKPKRDILYKNRVNPMFMAVGDGPIVMGQKTLQSKPSAFDRVAIRRLFIYMEKAISTASKYFLFEKNTPFTRRLFKGMIDPFLNEIVAKEGLLDFLVVCDESNNTGEVMDNNQMVVDIYIKAARDIEELRLNFIATKSGVSFSELINR